MTSQRALTFSAGFMPCVTTPSMKLAQYSEKCRLLRFKEINAVWVYIA